MKWFFLYCLLIAPALARSQGENNIWTLSSSSWGPRDQVITFNTVPPTVVSLPFEHGRQVTTVCYPNGQLRFLVDFKGLSAGESYLPKIYHPDGTIVVGSELSLGPTASEDYYPIIIPHPGNSDQYYIFYSNANALLYSLLDMGLNSGAGGIVNGQKDVFLSAYGTIMANMMTAVQGCNSVWLVLRSRTTNEYFSFAVTAQGLNINKVVSPCGNLPMNNLCTYRGGGLFGSPTGKHLVFLSRQAGIELYDFEKCSGKLTNARLLDTINNSCPIIYNRAHSWFHSACFSPDGTKLYITKNNVVDTAITLPYGGFIPALLMPGKLFQFDIGQPTLPQIIASKTLLLINQPSIMAEMFVCVNAFSNTLGDLKQGPNGKIYFDNGSYTCLAPGTVPPGMNMAAFHCINQPDLTGAACLVTLNEIIPDGYGETGFFFTETGSYLPPDIVVAPAAPDTAASQVFYPVACFADSLVLSANSLAGCYVWDDGSKTPQRTIRHSGTYYVSYFSGCSYQTDTFHANLVHIPTLVTQYQSCPGMYMGKLTINTAVDDDVMLNYTWKTADGSILAHRSGSQADTLSGLDTGTYFVQVTSSGCDTTLAATIIALPKPQVTAWPADTTIRYGDSIQLHAAGAMLYVWLPSGPLDSATKASPMARPLQPLVFSVIGLNEFGCRDTGYVNINIDYNMPDLIPNAFSPNGDGLNDVFRVEGISYQKIGHFSVYNRYGQQVFSTIDARQGWDGTKLGKPCDQGTYYYLIELHYPDGKIKRVKGDVILMR